MFSHGGDTCPTRTLVYITSLPAHFKLLTLDFNHFKMFKLRDLAQTAVATHTLAVLLFIHQVIPKKNTFTIPDSKQKNQNNCYVLTWNEGCGNGESATTLHLRRNANTASTMSIHSKHLLDLSAAGGWSAVCLELA